jgi:23S rRNA (uracil1939-C5)-methyltransferase
MSELVEIRGIAAGGDGVGTLEDGRTVFVPRSAPGDVLELAEVTLAKRFARARIARLVTPSPQRVEPLCPHYQRDDCGACQLQHLTAEAQRSVRSRLIGDALQRIGRAAVEPPSLVPSDQEWAYRAKITLAVKGRQIGYHRTHQPGRLFDLVHCDIARPEINELWQAVSAHRGLLPANATHLVLRIGRAGDRHLIVRAADAQVWTRAREMGEALVASGIPAVLWWEPEGGAARTVFGAREAYPAMVFEQVHPVMGDLVRQRAIALFGEVDGKHLWDLYAGIGESTRLLAERGATVESVELDRRAVAEAEARGPSEGVRRIAGRVESALRTLGPPDAILVNPPRTGLGEAVSDALLATSRPLVYVSCDPATLARDIARLRPALRLDQVHGFDLFPQTAHVETVARLLPL